MLTIYYLSRTRASEILASVSFRAALNRPLSQADLQAILKAVLEAVLEAVLKAVAGALLDTYTGVTHNTGSRSFLLVVLISSDLGLMYKYTTNLNTLI